MARGQKIPRYIPRRDWMRVIKLSPDARARAVVALGLFSGMRVAELCGLDLGDVDLANNVILVRRGKGAKERQLDLNPDAKPYLLAYLRERREGRPDALGEVPLFVSQHGSRLSTRQVQRLAEGLRESTGYEWLTPHKWRHSHATCLLQRSRNLELVRRQLGHDHISTTSIYTHVADDERREVVMRL